MNAREGGFEWIPMPMRTGRPRARTHASAIIWGIKHDGEKSFATLKCARFTSVPPNGVNLYGGSPLISYQCIPRSSISVPISR